jgi:cell division protein FtsZ
MDEITEITDYIQDEAGLTADIIWGSGTDDNLGDKICVTLIATGFSNTKEVGGHESGNKEVQKVVHKLTNEFKAPVPEQIDAATELTDSSLTTATEELPLSWEAQQKETASIPLEEEKVVRYNLYDSETAEDSEDIKGQSLSSNVNPGIEEDIPEKNTFSEPTIANAEESRQEEVITETPSYTFSQPKVEPQEDPGFSFTQMTTSVPSSEEVVPPVSIDSNTFAHELDEEENLKKSQERIAQLKNMSMKMQSPSGIADLENQPAYVRRNVQLNEVQSSAEEQNSRLTLGKDDQGETGLRSNNSFLHDNVD